MKLREMRTVNCVVGSGAAGFASALRLWQRGERDTLLITENLRAGTSRNTGSDKQTYYKLSLAGNDTDSVRAMAEDLFSGGCVDGDLALCEAALSARGFFMLAELGVPFPHTEYGEYMGYKTDHDRKRRATSAGPYTSKMMTEALEREANALGIAILDRTQVIRLLVRSGRIYGVLCLETDGSGSPSYLLIWCENVILATGGPAGMYKDSVYPLSQTGSSGIAFEAGVKGKNLTEWQYGAASKAPRWNVSGSYMQALPRLITTDADGGDAREFLNEYYDGAGEALTAVFLKGYQWPFDAKKTFGGSSVVDLLIYRETVLRGRRVFLDFTENPGGGELDFSLLSREAYAYLESAGALYGKPIDRLSILNAPAIDHYREHGVDLASIPLEIAICAQHNNGGLSTDAYWETDVRGVFAVGEVCGSHGVTRPGGSALNAGQVGAIRSAERISLRHKNGDVLPREKGAEDALRREAEAFILLPEKASGELSVESVWEDAARRMSECGGMIRSKEGLSAALSEVEKLLSGFEKTVKAPGKDGPGRFFKLRDMLISQKVYLSAMLSYLENGGGSRGSALYTDERGRLRSPGLPELFRCVPDEGAHDGVVQETLLTERGCENSFRPVRKIPDVDYFFENQWRLYRERENPVKTEE